MATTHSKSDQVFIVRAWTEPIDGEPSVNAWRGRVSHLNTKTESHFVGVTALMRIFEQALVSPANPSTTRQLENSEERP